MECSAGTTWTLHRRLVRSWLKRPDMPLLVRHSVIRSCREPCAVLPMSVCWRYLAGGDR
jgi:hypothetical protein